MEGKEDRINWAQMNKVFLKKDRESSLMRRHPWVFSGALERVEGSPGEGETVELVSHSGHWLARGAFSPHSQIRVRVWSWDENESIDSDFFRRRIADACRLRQVLSPGLDTDAYRLVYSESDGLPGLIVDHYAGFLVGQFLSAGAERWKKEITQTLAELIVPDGIYERSDTESRQKEGLRASRGLLFGEEPPVKLKVREGPFAFLVDVRRGHKTGFYTDQRENRRAVAKFSHARSVLNCFSYSGAFGIHAWAAGATHVTQVDASREALELARENAGLSSIPQEAFEYIEADVFRLLRTLGESGRTFDLVILDPPKFITSASQLARGARGYKDINMNAIKLLNPGGILATFSCSGYADPALFRKIVADAALDAGRQIKFVQQLHQGPDHPVAGEFPEALYLKGLVGVVS